MFGTICRMTMGGPYDGKTARLPAEACRFTVGSWEVPAGGGMLVHHYSRAAGDRFIYVGYEVIHETRNRTGG